MRAALAVMIGLLLATTVMADQQHSVVGTLQSREIDSRIFHQKRTVRIWLPAEYVADSDRRFDVLYMHDGQNCFDRATSAFGMEWQIDETLTKLIAEKTIRPIIAVGIDNGGKNRIDEMTFFTHPKYGGGHAERYVQFVFEEVMPLVEREYRVETGRAHTFSGGSSLGGLVSLEMAWRYPEKFGGVLAMSPSLWWPGEPIADDFAKHAEALKATRFWIDTGTAEDDKDSAADVARVRLLDKVMATAKLDHRMMIDEGAKHNEAAWAKRFPLAIQFLLNGK